jgi:thioredoxin reductase (NADPH)
MSEALNLQIGERVNARAVVIATGARYRRPDVENLNAFEASGIAISAPNFCA